MVSTRCARRSRWAQAKGCSISDDSLRGSDALTTARVLAAAIRREGFDLVITATESTDGYTGVVPQMIAELLDVPAVTFAKTVEVDGTTLKVKRQTEAGYDLVEANLPAVVSVTAGVNEPRYPSLKGIMGAKSKPLDRVTPGDLGLDGAGGGPLDRASRVSRPRRSARPVRSSRTTARATSGSRTSSPRRR